MTIQEIINNLRDMDNKLSFSATMPWQTALISDAKELKNVTDSNEKSILPFVMALSAVRVECNADVSNAYYFCLIPLSGKKWKVYVLNRFRRVLAQLEDFEGEIYSEKTSVATSFLLKGNG